jgi:hypothetical protein
MAYVIQAFIIGVPRSPVVPSVLKPVRMPQGYILLPLTETARAALAIPSLPLTDEQREQLLPTGLADLGVALSVDGFVAYIEAEFFGGVGTQASVVWKDGRMVQPVIVSADAINLALSALGVQAATDEDEFATLGARAVQLY